MRILYAILSMAILCCIAATNVPVGSPSKRSATKLQTSGFVGASAEGRYQGTEYLTELRWPDIEKSPRWVAADKPPLSPKEAETIARSCLEAEVGIPPSPAIHLPEVETWNLTQIALRRWYRIDVWFYEIKMVPHFNGTGAIPSMTVFVTFDGKAIPPKKVKKPTR